jgi:thymidine kinase
MKPKLIVNVGGMFSGKSTELQRQGTRHILRGHKVTYIKPKLDNRYSEDELVTHDGRKVKAMNVGTDDYFVNRIPVDTDVVLIDEVQFFTETLLEVIDALLVGGTRVYCSGLDLDFEGNPFGITPLLMAKADEVHKLHAVCDKCGNDAWVTPRISQDTEKVKLGEKDDYFPLCRACYYEHKYEGFWGFKKC